MDATFISEEDKRIDEILEENSVEESITSADDNDIAYDEENDSERTKESKRDFFPINDRRRGQLEF